MKIEGSCGRKWGFLPFFGGTFNNGSNVSPRYRNCNNGFGNANWNYGSRPLSDLMVLTSPKFYIDDDAT